MFVYVNHVLEAPFSKTHTRLLESNYFGGLGKKPNPTRHERIIVREWMINRMALQEQVGSGLVDDVGVSFSCMPCFYSDIIRP